MTTDTKPNSGYKGLLKGVTGKVYASPVVKKYGEVTKMTITEGN